MEQAKMEIKDASNEQLTQGYSNACAQLGNTETLICELESRISSIRRDLDKLLQKKTHEVAQAQALRRELEKRGSSERKN